jgi:hypothetical protein
MSARLTRELLSEVAQQAIGKARIVFLCQDLAQADRLADRFRKALIDEAIEQGVAEITARTKIFRPAGSNPSFVQLLNGGWVFFYPASDLNPEDDIGHAQTVYWPSEGGNFEKVTYDFWKKERRKGCMYRPVTTAETAPKKKKVGRPTAWDRLLEDDD